MQSRAETPERESPAWHGDLLRETEQRYKAGLERPVDWATAKRELHESTMLRALVYKTPRLGKANPA